MYITVIILSILFVSVELIRFILNKNWVLIYSAIGNEEYFKIIAILKERGIKYKMEISHPDFSRGRFKDNTNYDVYVKKNDVSDALKVLNNR